MEKRVRKTPHRATPLCTTPDQVRIEIMFVRSKRSFQMAADAIVAKYRVRVK